MISKWGKATFAEVAQVVTGNTPSTQKPEYFGGTIPFVTPVDLDSGRPVTTSKTKLTALGAEQSRLLPRGAVMVSCIGTLGKIGFAGTEVVTNQQINSLVFDRTIVDPLYGYHFCRTLRPMMEQIAPSTTLPIINKGRFSKFEIPLPPLEEQKRIADVLDKADALRQKRRLALQKLDTLLQSVFFEKFGDPLNQVGKINGFKRFEEIAEIYMGQSPKGDSYNVEGKGQPLLNGPTEFGRRHPTARQWTTSPTKICRDGDILFCVRGATAGRMNVSNGQYCVGRGLAFIRPHPTSGISNDFIFTVLERYYSYFQQKGVGSTFINISGEELKKLPFPSASESDVTDYTAIYRHVQMLKENAFLAIAQSERLFAALQAYAFNGQLVEGSVNSAKLESENAWQQTSHF